MNQNDGLPQNAPWVPPQNLVTSTQVMQNPQGSFAARRGQAIRQQAGPQPNPSALGWAAMAAGAAALAGGGYHLYKRHQQSQRAGQTGMLVSDDCTTIQVTDPDLATAYTDQFLASSLEALGDARPATLVMGASFVEVVAPDCGVKVTENGIEGVDTWQKAAMVGGAALVFSGSLHEQGAFDDEQFRVETETVSTWLLENGVDDLSMIEQVYLMPEPPAPGGGGVEGQSQVRAPNMGLIGWGLTGVAAAAAGSGAYFAWRNKKLHEACLTAREWFAPDGSVTPEAEVALDSAIEVAIAEGAPNAIEAADRAIQTLAENPECRLPKLIWGNLLKVRALAVAKAAALMGDGMLPPPPPSPEETGMVPIDGCTKMNVSSPSKADAYTKSYMEALDLSGEWTPDPIMLAAQYLNHLAPECGVYVSTEGTPEIMGVDTWQKAAMVGAFSLVFLAELQGRGMVTDEQFTELSLRINEWLAAHGVDDLTMIEDVFQMPGLTPGGTSEAPGRFETQPVPPDEWGQPPQNEYLDGGSVGGDNGGRWRVYKDNTGEYNNQYYFVVWRAGEYTTLGPFPTQAAAKNGALHQFELQGNPQRVSRHFPMQPRFNNPTCPPNPDPKRCYYKAGCKLVCSPGAPGQISARRAPSQSAIKRMIGSLFGDLRLRRRMRSRNPKWVILQPTKLRAR